MHGMERALPVQRAWIGLGANLGDPAGQVRRALALLAAQPGVRVAACSPFYRSEPVGGPSGQPWFVNACAELHTDDTPRRLLARLLAVEVLLGRQRGQEVRWGPRCLDLDLLLGGVAGEVVGRWPGLELPHPRLAERRFVLRPLADIAPGLRHPGLGKTVDTLLQETQDPARVEPLL